MNAKIEACPRDGQDRDERPGSAPHWLTTAGRIPASGMLVEAAGTSLGSAVNLLAVAVLTGLPGLRVRPGRVLGPALLGAAGLEMLKTLGGVYATYPAQSRLPDRRRRCRATDLLERAQPAHPVRRRTDRHQPTSRR